MHGKAEKAKNFKGSLRRLLSYLKPHRMRLFFVFLLAVASTTFTISAPKISGQVMNKVKDSFMARMLLDQMTKLQKTMRSGMSAQAAAAAEPSPNAPMDPALGAALARFAAIPDLSSISDPATQAEALRDFMIFLEGLPPQAAALMPAGPSSPAFAGMKFTKEQIQDALRAVEETGGKVDYPGIGMILGFLLCFYLLSALFTFGSGWLMSTVAQRTVYDLRKAVDRKLGRLPLAYFDSHSHGEILSRVSNDIDSISGTLQQSVTQAITSVISLVGYVIMMLTISWGLTLIVLATMPLYIIATMALAKNSQKHFKAQQKELGAISGHIEEMYSGHAVVKAFGREKRALAEFDEINQKLSSASWKANFISGILHPAMNTISNLGYVLISVVGGMWMTRAWLNLGDITAFIQYSRQFTMPIIQTANIANIIQSTIACAERVFEVLDEAEEEEDSVGASMPAQAQGEVSINSLAFSYNPAEPLIRDLSLDVRKGHTIAIVGPTGAGKTTLVNLLMRFYEIQAGSISIDGADIRTMPRSGLRALFGMVLQDTWLFNGSIRENIAYGRTEASEEEIVQAAKAAHADHFIRTLPSGYDTLLFEDASNISQGQRQLLTIARAILANPRILILDEATSSVDTRTEFLIQKAMAALMQDRTSFVIAHRLSTIRDAELILVMDHGAIVEQGNHRELLEKKGFYAELYNAQFTGALVESA